MPSAKRDLCPMKKKRYVADFKIKTQNFHQSLNLKRINNHFQWQCLAKNNRLSDQSLFMSLKTFD